MCRTKIHIKWYSFYYIFSIVHGFFLTLQQGQVQQVQQLQKKMIVYSQNRPHYIIYKLCTYNPFFIFTKNNVWSSKYVVREYYWKFTCTTLFPIIPDLSSEAGLMSHLISSTCPLWNTVSTKILFCLNSSYIAHNSDFPMIYYFPGLNTSDAFSKAYYRNQKYTVRQDAFGYQ